MRNRNKLFPFLELDSNILWVIVDTSILRRNGSLANETCWSLTALFVKTKIYLCCCNIENKHISKNPLNHFFPIDCSQKVKPKIFQKMFAVLKMELQINEHLLKMSLYLYTKNPSLKREFYNLSNDIYI